LSAQDHIRPVSCYALFQWWLLLSQHPGCLRAPTSFYTELDFGTLAVGLGCFPFDREAYPPQSHSRTLACARTGIRSLVDFGNLVGPLGHPVLYLRFVTSEAVPQYISGRTSYLQVRLAFHRYPQLIPAVFNRHGFGPPSGDYPDFNLVMGRSPGFGSAPADCGRWIAPPALALFGLGFPAASRLSRLTLPANATRRFILQKARHHRRVAPPALTACRRWVSGSLSLPSRGAFHLSLTVLVRYRWPEVFSLRRWSSSIPPGFLVSRGTRELRPEPPRRPLPGSHRLWRAFPDVFR
jgi:hypothetical protein